MAKNATAPSLDLPVLAEKRCPNCGGAGLSVFYELRGVPAHSVLLLRTREKAVSYPRGDLVLGFCSSCGFVTNTAFDPRLNEYSPECEETQGFSPTFNAFHRGLAERLIHRHDLHGKRILEIGCGKGEFITLLCAMGENNEGVGIDPAYVPGRFADDPRIEFIQDLYSEKYTHIDADFVCCKMTLEHIPDTLEFVSMVRRSLADRYETQVFFQIPDAARVLSELAFWDIYYEHCTYFSLGSLARLFRKAGFDVEALDSEYDGQYITVEATPSRPGARPSAPLPEEDDLGELHRLVGRFAREHGGAIAHWRAIVAKARAAGRKPVIWGSGSKAVAFLCTLGCGPEEIEYLVDINPNKHGTFSAGTGQEIVAPAFLESYRPDLVILMNPIYRKEIGADLKRMGLEPELLAV
jgi:SAM-dependent methyltransferase